MFCTVENADNEDDPYHANRPKETLEDKNHKTRPFKVWICTVNFFSPVKNQEEKTKQQRYALTRKWYGNGKSTLHYINTYPLIWWTKQKHRRHLIVIIGIVLWAYHIGCKIVKRNNILWHPLGSMIKCHWQKQKTNQKKFHTLEIHFFSHTVYSGTSRNTQ